ncbi:DNA polymerase III subunit alpha [Aquimonas voraii]|uniref:DNA polymerase III subunit alpha n=1 Tax=Aquimonas voraii TaxID=265719 RepID=A0A1G6S665_9GAMM|nr:DNA polymerase III subunit alpha [Aquimonas voraii]SDD11686.1 DNA polymerase III, alpha subunit [Aquimonas voraii]
MPARFVHLHLHSEFSLVDSTIRLPQLIKRCAALELPAVAVTDLSNLFGLIKFYKEAQKAGIKPIAGSDVIVQAADGSLSRLTLLCRNREGYLNLSRLLSRAFLDGHQGDFVCVRPDWVSEHAGGLFALAGPGSDIGQLLREGKSEPAEARLRELQQQFDDRLYLELVRTRREGEEDFIAGACDLAIRRGLGVVASNDVRFLEAEDYEAHEARVCISTGRVLGDPRRPREYSDQQYLKSSDEMSALFADIPAALENSLELARRCNLELRLGTYFLPAFPVPDEHTLDSWIRSTAHEGLNKRLEKAPIAPGHTRQSYFERLDVELGVICKMGFPGYFLIVADFINWAKQNDIPVGPGRGSGAGSLVAWALGITDLDPIPYDLLFERFLNPERVSMPDFDIDFCMDRRDEVIDYVARKYGRDRVSQIITFGTMAAKAAVRDCGRVQGLPFPAVDGVAKLIPNTLGISLDDALGRSKAAQEDKELCSAELIDRYQHEDEVRDLMDLALKLEDLTRNAGKHAGGVVIAPEPLTEFSPLFAEPPPKEPGALRSVVTQYDKDDVEAAGLVKFDFLGLRTLTIIDWAVKAINRRLKREGRELLDITALPLDDKPSYELFARGDTVAVFQFESRGMRELLKRARPDRFEDIIALAALFRPGPLGSGMDKEWCDRKHGETAVTYPHPLLEPVLSPTYGVIVYQEQVMQIAQVLAGYTLGGADMLRRAMGKKKPEEMAKERAKFEAGCAERQIDPQTATSIFDLMEKFAEYGFNKSHSAAYALVAYQTAWLKVHYPAEFMAAVLSSDMDKTDKVVTFLAECRVMKLDVALPHVNRSSYAFEADTPRSIVYGLGAIKGMGRQACEAIVEARGKGEFTSLYDLCSRVEVLRRNRRSLETLIAAGALDGLGPNRASLMEQLPDVLRACDQQAKAREVGQVSLFDLGGSAPEPVLPELPSVPEFPLEKLLEDEYRVLGHYISGHPIDPWRDLLGQVITCDLGGLDKAYSERKFARGTEASVLLAGVVGDVRRSGESRAFVQLQDGRGQIEAALFSEACAQYAPLIKSREIVLVEGSLQEDRMGDGYSLRLRRLLTLEELCAKHSRHLLLKVDNRTQDALSRVEELLASHRPGHTGVQIELMIPGARGRLYGDGGFAVRPTPLLPRMLREIPGVEVELRLQKPEPTPMPERRAAG